MEPQVCSSCQKPKANLACGACAAILCKYCAQKLAEEDFVYETKLAVELTHPFYCVSCFDETVAPRLAEYYEILELAKTVFVFTKDMGKEARLIKRKEAVLKVEDCADHEDTLMRLAYLAAKSKHNALVDVVISHEKVRTAGYQTTKWSGVAVPASIEARRYENRPASSNPN